MLWYCHPLVLVSKGARRSGSARGLDQDHLSLLVGKAEYEYLGHEAADLLGRKIHHGSDLTTDEIFDLIVFSDLCGGLALAAAGSQCFGIVTLWY